MASYGYTFNSGDGVTPTRLNDARTISAIQTADISDAQITAAKLASNAVETAKILDANVTTAKIADSAVTTAKINDSAVTTAKINDAAVTAAKLDGAQTGSAPIYGCRAWVNFDGTTGSTVDGEFRCTIRASGNVNKVVRNATGDYTVHFTTAMPDANYAASVIYTDGISNNGVASNGHVYASGSFQFRGTRNSSGTLVNSVTNSVIIFR